MSEARDESKRVYKEFRKFYDKHPEYNSRSNDDMFLSYAEQCGGRELISAEQLELWLDVLKGNLAVFSENPQQAMSTFMSAHPEYDCEANRKMLIEHLRSQHQPIISQKIAEAFAEIKSILAVNQQIADEHAAKLEAEEREELCRFISKTYGRTQASQDLKYRELIRTSTQYLQDRAAQIRANTELHRMSKQQVKDYIHQQRETPAVELPAEYTPSVIKQMKPDAIRKLTDRYGLDVVNQRLGYVKPEDPGLTRTIRVPLATR